MQASSNNAINKIGQRTDSIHEYPEPGQRRRRLEDAVENQSQTEHESGDVAGCFGVRESGDEHVREGRCEDEELGAIEEDEALAVGGLDSVDGVEVYFFQGLVFVWMKRNGIAYKMRRRGHRGGFDTGSRRRCWRLRMLSSCKLLMDVHGLRRGRVAL